MLLAPHEPYQVALIGVHAARVVGVEIGLEGVVGSNVIAIGWRAIERGMVRCGSHLSRLDIRLESKYDLSVKRGRKLTDVFDDAKMKSTFTFGSESPGKATTSFAVVGSYPLYRLVPWSSMSYQSYQ